MSRRLAVEPDIDAGTYRLQPWLPNALRMLAILMGAVHTWAAIRSHSMNADGISYLDIGDAYFRGDWAAAINSVWSPMYSWVLGLAMNVVSPPAAWEFPLVHLVNFLIFLGCLASFDFFWRHVLRYKRERSDSETERMHHTLPEWSWWVVGYLLFIWTSLAMINIWSVTPDLLMAAFVYLAAALVLRIRMGQGGRGVFILLGITLGAAYLTKSVMFPIGFVFIGVSMISAGSVRKALPGAILALLFFLLISLPFVAAISVAKGRLTFGDAGKLTYVRLVNGVPYPHWQGESDSDGTPQHPSERLLDQPPVYGFASPVSGTYPISYDPAYWYEGVSVRLNVKRQLGRLIGSSIHYFELFFHQQAALSIAFLILYLMGIRDRRSWNSLSRFGLSIVALAAFGMYALVLVEDRYVAVFTVLFWADIFANERLPASKSSRSLSGAVASIMVLLLLANLATFNLKGFQDLFFKNAAPSEVRLAPGPPGWPGEVAAELERLGVRSGEKVAVIGYAFDSYWARLARVKIVGEMFDGQAYEFWFGDDAVRNRVLRAFATTGARVVVAERVPEHAAKDGWHQVGQSNYFIRFLER